MECQNVLGELERLTRRHAAGIVSTLDPDSDVNRIVCDWPALSGALSFLFAAIFPSRLNRITERGRFHVRSSRPSP